MAEPPGRRAGKVDVRRHDLSQLSVHGPPPASGITFKHRIVDAAGNTYKAAHYDHGNGIAMADVDGDGLLDIYFVSQVGGNRLWKNLGGPTARIDSPTYRSRPASSIFPSPVTPPSST